MKRLQILGPGCWRCEALKKNTEAAAEELGIDYQIEKVTNIKDIMSAGVMMTPALVVDGKVKVAGKIPTPDEIKKMLQ